MNVRPLRLVAAVLASDGAVAEEREEVENAEYEVDGTTVAEEDVFAAISGITPGTQCITIPRGPSSSKTAWPVLASCLARKARSLRTPSGAAFHDMRSTPWFSCVSEEEVEDVCA